MLFTNDYQRDKTRQERYDELLVELGNKYKKTRRNQDGTMDNITLRLFIAGLSVIAKSESTKSHDKALNFQIKRHQDMLDSIKHKRLTKEK